MLIGGVTTGPEWSYIGTRSSRYSLVMDMSKTNRLQGCRLKRRNALLSSVFPIVPVAEYGRDVSSQTALIVSHRASTSSNNARSGFRETSSSFTGRAEFPALHRRGTGLVSCTILGTFWASAKRKTLKHIATP